MGGEGGRGPGSDLVIFRPRPATSAGRGLHRHSNDFHGARTGTLQQCCGTRSPHIRGISLHIWTRTSYTLLNTGSLAHFLTRERTE